MTKAPPATWQGQDLILRLRVQPRAGRNELIVEAGGERLRARLTAAPVEGQANKGLVQLLAAQCGVPRSAVSIESGASGRDKRVRIQAPRRLPESLSQLADTPP